MEDIQESPSEKSKKLEKIEDKEGEIDIRFKCDGLSDIVSQTQPENYSSPQINNQDNIHSTTKKGASVIFNLSLEADSKLQSEI